MSSSLTGVAARGVSCLSDKTGEKYLNDCFKAHLGIWPCNCSQHDGGTAIAATPLDMPSFADALNRIGFFWTAVLLAQLLHSRFEALNRQRVHMVVDQLPGHAQ